MPNRLFQTANTAPPPVLNIAHRGARAYAPENTLAAFEKAKRLGCQMFEIDVHQAKDGELIVHHDDQLTRCTDVKLKFPGRADYYVSDFSSAELSALDAGSWYCAQLTLPASQRQAYLQALADAELTQFVSQADRDHYASGAIQIPTFMQTLELARRLDLLINIEIKALPRGYPGIADAIVEQIEGLAMTQHVLISSFDHTQLQQVRQRNRQIATAVLTSDRLAQVSDYLRRLDADAYHPSLDSLGLYTVQKAVDSDTIKQLRADGFAVNAWTCNDKKQMRQLLEAGVSGLISDYPNRIREVLDSFLNLQNNALH
jgi:glycerophosphoryl diester phosphodiesterase